MFGTYLAQPSRGHAAMAIGVDAFRTADDQHVGRLLVQPLLDTPGGYPINRRPEGMEAVVSSISGRREAQRDPQ